jgi:hypothetical protein
MNLITEEDRIKLQALAEAAKQMFPQFEVLISLVDPEKAAIVVKGKCPACMVENTVQAALQSDMKHDSGESLFNLNYDESSFDDESETRH